MQILAFTFAVMLFGAFSTFLLVTTIPEKVLIRASRHGRYTGLEENAAEAAATVRGRSAMRRRITQSLTVRGM
jgi:LPS O-antigen subunit length determinant protein (WzzB/FepE family)